MPRKPKVTQKPVKAPKPVLKEDAGGGGGGKVLPYGLWPLKNDPWPYPDETKRKTNETMGEWWNRLQGPPKEVPAPAQRAPSTPKITWRTPRRGGR